MDYEKIVPYQEREKMKQEGWEAFHESMTLDGKSRGILRVIDSHYFRQMEMFYYDPREKTHTKLVVGKKYTKGYVLEIDDYTPHWLYSMRHMVPRDVMECIKENFGYVPMKCDYLIDGNTTYNFERRENTQ